MPSIHFTQNQALVKALDKNRNQVMDELIIDPAFKPQVDTDGNGELSAPEVLNALQADKIEIQGNKIAPLHNKQIHIQGLETLRNIHTTLDRTLSAPHVWAPRVSDNLDAAADVIGLLAGAEDKRSYAEQRRDENRRLESSSMAYLGAVMSMRGSLHAVEDMTRNATDSRSQALNKQAQASLSRSAAWTAGSLVGGLIFGSASAENAAIQGAYNTAKTTMVSMREQTKNLPDLDTSLKEGNQQLGSALHSLEQVKGQINRGEGLSKDLLQAADNSNAKATGRTAPYAGTGSAIGAVAGGVAGYFLGGRTLKAAGIGAAAGGAGGAGLGALIGSGIDSSHKAKAEALRADASLIRSFKPEQAEAALLNETEKLYGQLVQARQTHDIDRATVVQNEINATRGRIQSVQAETDKVAKIFSQPKK